MPSAISAYLAEDHRRLEALLQSALADGDLSQSASYAAFRRGLLRHIAIEEKLLLPAAQLQHRGEPLPLAAKLRLDHGAIAALLVPLPTVAIIATLQTILTEHDALEEDPGGVYEACDKLIGADVELLEKMQARPEPPVNPLSDNPLVLPALHRALARAGYVLQAGAAE